MELMDGILTRRSIGRVKPEAVDKELIAKVLEAAVWAPNHRHTEPWRFVVMTGDGRGRLGDAYADIYRLEHPDADEESVRKQRAKAFRAPVVAAACCSPSGAKGVIELEEYAAVYAGIQNMLLDAHSLGLGAIWRTGEPAYHPRMNEAFGLGEQDRVLGLIYIGWPDMEPPKAVRTPAAERTVWIEE
ncbi:nitroreductase family protein [Paenibacillus thermotolerans]|uniref:nitroreductase family protein n=1 Tax=Paenibacillus thermotolerans TaxID=3027807 RepID=UPI0023681DFA|nr:MULTISPECIES: nitroreductase [unclassified Paenibacillus]